MAILRAMREKYGEIAVLIAAFCDDRLNGAYKVLCLKLLEALCRKRPSPLLANRGETWAAGIVYAICANNRIFQSGNPLRMPSAELAATFDVVANAASTKAAEI